MSELREPGRLLSDRTAVIRLGRSERALIGRLAVAVGLGCRRIVVDLGEAPLLECATLTGLQRAGARLRGRGGELTVVVPSAPLARSLRLTKLEEGFAVVRSLADARPTRARITSKVELELPADHSFDPVARLVAAGVGSRAGLGTDVIVELQRALAEVLRSSDAPTAMALQESEHDLSVEIGPIASRDSGRELERVLSTIVKAVETRCTGGDVWITMRLPTRSRGVERRCPS